ncbi:MAG: Terminase-like family protein [Candidatus Bathyarchaeota archaeon BA1]|nr:MAG: Terminase-like family protein [Candidatus Bathyarchaeota archaeon BA1]
MDEKAFVDKVISDLNFAASVSEGLMQRPKAFKQLLSYKEVTRKLVEDPVFFAVLMCGDKWLAEASNHQRLLRDLNPRQVAVCGRGWGKSLVFSRKNLWLLFTKPKVESLIISSTQRQSMIMFDYCYFTIMANPLMREMVQRPGTTRTVIRLKAPLGGKLVALPCSPDKLRGYHPDWVFIDEASIVPSEMITSEIMMMLTKPNAGLVMSGTPMSFDHVFRKAFLDRKKYSVHHYPSYSSPLVSQEQLNEWQEMMTKEEWQREVEALWVEVAHTFFPMDLIISCVDPELGNPDSPNQYIENIEEVSPAQLKGPCYAGLDLGKQVDYSVLAVVQKTEDGRVRLIHKRQFPLGTPYPDVVAYVTRAHQVFNFEGLCVDKTGIGDAIVDELEAIEVPNVKGIFFADIEKENMLNYLKLLMEKGLLKILGDDKQLIAQINEQQYEYLRPKTAQERIHLKFWHPPGRHDDQLYALALACMASKETEPKPYLAVVPR